MRQPGSLAAAWRQQGCTEAFESEPPKVGGGTDSREGCRR